MNECNCITDCFKTYFFEARKCRYFVSLLWQLFEILRGRVPKHLKVQPVDVVQPPDLFFRHLVPKVLQGRSVALLLSGGRGLGGDLVLPGKLEVVLLGEAGPVRQVVAVFREAVEAAEDVPSDPEIYRLCY